MTLDKQSKSVGLGGRRNSADAKKPSKQGKEPTRHDSKHEIMQICNSRDLSHFRSFTIPIFVRCVFDYPRNWAKIMQPELKLCNRPKKWAKRKTRRTELRERTAWNNDTNLIFGHTCEKRHRFMSRKPIFKKRFLLNSSIVQ